MIRYCTRFRSHSKLVKGYSRRLLLWLVYKSSDNSRNGFLYNCPVRLLHSSCLQDIIRWVSPNFVEEFSFLLPIFDHFIVRRIFCINYSITSGQLMVVKEFNSIELHLSDSEKSAI